MKFTTTILFFILLHFPTLTNAFTLDEKVRLAINTFELLPATCSINEDLINVKLINIGDIIFNTKILSGDKDVSCSTCHLDNKALTDGLALAIGVGGEGEGDKRLGSDGIIVPRNTFTLFGRANRNYQTFFWDGRIQEEKGRIISPIGEGYSLGFDSALAVASSMPILARDEFLGVMSMFNNNQNIYHVEDAYYKDKIPAIEKVLVERLKEDNDPDIIKLISAMKEVGYHPNDLSLPLIGNSLASFIATKVSKCEPSDWDNYISGNLSALTKKQKDGALIFYGKGRCAACHNGSLFSDMKYHSIGVPQGRFGTHINGSDIGRAQVTFKQEDRFKFRTPSLIKVKDTPPYGHNGKLKTLDAMVLYHINPIPYFTENDFDGEKQRFTYGKILSSRSSVLGHIDITEDTEFKALIEFLKAL